MSSEEKRERWCIRCNKGCTNYRTITDDTGHDLHHCNECDGLVVNPQKVTFSYDDITDLTTKLAAAENELARVRESLGHISRPLNYLQGLKALKGDEFEMEWPVAIRLSDSSEFLKQIARDALLAPAKEADDGK